MWSKVTLDVTMEGDLIPVQIGYYTYWGASVCYQVLTEGVRGLFGLLQGSISLLPAERGHCKMDDQKNLDSQTA